jgi:hypothetical protein
VRLFDDDRGGFGIDQGAARGTDQPTVTIDAHLAVGDIEVVTESEAAAR